MTRSAVHETILIYIFFLLWHASRRGKESEKGVQEATTLLRWANGYLQVRTYGDKERHSQGVTMDDAGRQVSRTLILDKRFTPIIGKHGERRRLPIANPYTVQTLSGWGSAGRFYPTSNVRIRDWNLRKGHCMIFCHYGRRISVAVDVYIVYIYLYQLYVLWRDIEALTTLAPYTCLSSSTHSWVGGYTEDK